MNTTIADFEWDSGNHAKCQQHGVSIREIEGLFSRPVVLLPDDDHSATEKRFRAVGRTETGQHVFLIFTIRERESKRYIRPISARYMHRKEIASYEEENPYLSD